jgi:PKD repeat protein
VTLEFWLNWSAFANNDALALEFTPNFNDNNGGFLVDPNAPQASGRFGVGFGNNSSRNDAYFVRPTAGAWHYYAIVLDPTAPAAQQITPYVDGQPVSFVKTANGTGATFANSTLYFMSRAGAALFGQGNMDELAIYTRSLTASEVASRYAAGVNVPPTASFTASPTTANPGQTVSFNGSASADSDGSIAKYEWDLDGNGTYETDTGTTATTTKSYTTSGAVTVKLRVTDNKGATAETSRTVTVQRDPTAAFTLSPNPADSGQTVTFNGSTSSDPDGSIAKYEWDLDGNGSYETDAGTTATTTRSYTAAGTVNVGLRVTDNNGATNTVTHALTVNGAPTASFTVSPNPAQTRGTVTFNGSASSVSGGTITKYEWDLDGNGSYETNTNATATTTKVYDTESTITVGLRVTASNGLTATTTRSLTIQSLYAQAVRTTAGLRAYWRLAETTGTTANDETTNNLDGTYENTPTLGAAGLLAGDSNRAVDLVRSSSERITVADNTLLDPTNLTLEAWVRPDSSLSFGQVRTIFAKSNSNANDFSYSLDYRRSGFTTNQLVFSVTTTSNTDYTVTQTLNSGTKYHIAATYNGSTMRIYVNGVQVGSGQSKTGNLRNSAQPLRIGAFWSSDYWDGAIDEAAVYSTALSAAQIQSHYTNGA